MKLATFRSSSMTRTRIFSPSIHVVPVSTADRISGLHACFHGTGRLASASRHRAVPGVWRMSLAQTMMSATVREPNSSIRWSPVGLVAAILIAAIAGSQGIELFINRVLRPDLSEWSWISEILMTVAFCVATTLWMRLRLAQTAVLELERERVRTQAELAVAANVQRGLLPAIPAPADGITWFAAMEPAGLVGG